MGFDATTAPTDLELGLRRARAAALLTLALPGATYVYQGEELGLPEVECLPEAALQDPTWQRSGGTARGRDGCRVPLPWEGDEPPSGFSPAGTPPWLPQPAEWRRRTVQVQEQDPGPTLTLYRDALRLRRRTTDLHSAPLTWRDAGSEVLAFDRGPRFRCVVNLSGGPVRLDPRAGVLLASEPGTTDALLPDTAVWLRVDPGGAIV